MAALLNNLSLARSQEQRFMGFARISEIVVEVRWPWSAPPASPETLGVIFLLTIMFRRRRVTGAVEAFTSCYGL